jgi:hypothetical protein
MADTQGVSALREKSAKLAGFVARPERQLDRAGQTSRILMACRDCSRRVADPRTIKPTRNYARRTRYFGGESFAALPGGLTGWPDCSVLITTVCVPSGASISCLPKILSSGLSGGLMVGLSGDAAYLTNGNDILAAGDSHGRGGLDAPSRRRTATG